jgi:hypothetical protein
VAAGGPERESTVDAVGEYPVAVDENLLRSAGTGSLDGDLAVEQRVAGTRPELVVGDGPQRIETATHTVAGDRTRKTPVSSPSALGTIGEF